MLLAAAADDEMLRVLVVRAAPRVKASLQRRQPSSTGLCRPLLAMK